MTDLPPASRTPVVRPVSATDLRKAIAAGVHDFRRAPKFGLLIAAFFVISGALMYLQLAVWGASWLILPVALGLPLIGPFVVVGLYEVSRELEKGQTPTWSTVASTIFSQRNRQIPSMAFVMLFFLGIWVNLAHLIAVLSFGLGAMTSVTSSLEILLTSQGLMMLAVGSIVGAILSYLLFSITVISLPLMMDREVDIVTAMIASFSTVLRSPKVMLSWGVLVGVLTLVAMIPAFLGLLVVLPVMGHATWHIYRCALEPEEG